MNQQKTKRQRRNDRPRLSVGDTGISGKVVVRKKNFGYIWPDNNAKRIFFHMSSVPYDRRKCVGIGRTVFFKVTAGRKDKNGQERIAACIV